MTLTDAATENNVDIDIIVKLKKENRHLKPKNTNTPIRIAGEQINRYLYYPLDSWFIRTTAVKDRMIELNKTINWKPESPVPAVLATGSKTWSTGTFPVRVTGVSHCRYGSPKTERNRYAFRSVEQLKKEIEKSVKQDL